MDDSDVEEDGPWKPMLDHKSGRIYFYNTVTGASQWENPVLEERRNSNKGTGVATPRRNRTGKRASVLSGPSEEIRERSQRHIDFGEASPWEMLRDPKTTRVFFFNRDEGYSQWERPEELVDVQGLDLNSEKDMEQVWETFNDPQSGRRYYYNRVNGLSTWEPPKELRDESQAKSPPKPDPGDANHQSMETEESMEKWEDWRSIKDPETDRTYYFNARTGESSWLHPRVHQQQELQKSLKDKYDPLGVWVELEDKATGRSYYYHKFTGETRWTLQHPNSDHGNPEVNGEPSSPATNATSGLSSPNVSVPAKKQGSGRLPSLTQADIEEIISAAPPEGVSTKGLQNPSPVARKERTDHTKQQASPKIESEEGSVFTASTLEHNVPGLPRSRRNNYNHGDEDDLGNSDDDQQDNLEQGAEYDENESYQQGGTWMGVPSESTRRRRHHSSIHDVESLDMESYSVQSTSSMRPGPHSRSRSSHVKSPPSSSHQGQTVRIVGSRMQPESRKGTTQPLAGYLEKRARHGLSNWQTRWFTFDGEHLRYFLNEDAAVQGKRPLASIDLKQVREVKSAEDDHEFELLGHTQGLGGVLCTLRSDSPENKNVWVEAICNASNSFLSKRESRPSPGRQSLGSSMNGKRSKSKPLDSPSTVSSSFGLLSPQPIRSPPSDENDNPVYAECIRSFAALEPGQLSFAVGDIIRVVEKRENQRWWIGEIGNDAFGKFLPSYVRLLGGNDADVAMEFGNFGTGGEIPPDSTSVASHQGMNSNNSTSTPPIVGRAASSAMMSSSNLSAYSVHSSGGSTLGGGEQQVWMNKLRTIFRQLGMVNGDDSIVSNGGESQAYPTITRLNELRNEVATLNDRNHRFKADVRGLQWFLHREGGRDSESVHAFLTTASRAIASNQTKLSVFGELVYYLQRQPRLLVLVGSGLRLEAQYILAATIANSLLDVYSTPSELFLEVVREATHAFNSQSERSAGSLFEHFLPSLLAAYAQRNECRKYLDEVLLPIKGTVAQALRSPDTSRWRFDSSKNQRFSQGAVDLASSIVQALGNDGALHLVPEGVHEVARVLADAGGESAVRRFILDVLLLPVLTMPTFLSSEGDPRIQSRIDQVMASFKASLGRNIAATNHVSMTTMNASVNRILAQLMVTAHSPRQQPGPPEKVAEMCNQVVISCFELYMLHVVLSNFVNKSRPLAPVRLQTLLRKLGPAVPLQDSEQGNPYVVLRLRQNLADFPTQLGIDNNSLDVLMRARSRLEALSVPSTRGFIPAQEDPILVSKLEQLSSNIKESLIEQERLMANRDLAQVYYSELFIQKERLLDSINGQQTRMDSSPPPLPIFARTSSGGSRSLHVETKTNDNGEEHSSPLASLLATVFSPMKLEENK